MTGKPAPDRLSPRFWGAWLLTLPPESWQAALAEIPSEAKGRYGARYWAEYYIPTLKANAKNIPTPFAIPQGASRSRCRACNAELFWVPMKSGRKMPVEPRGNGMGVSHWERCPGRERFRRRRAA